jgi:hypothetical protein
MGQGLRCLRELTQWKEAGDVASRSTNQQATDGGGAWRKETGYAAFSMCNTAYLSSLGTGSSRVRVYASHLSSGGNLINLPCKARSMLGGALGKVSGMGLSLMYMGPKLAAWVLSLIYMDPKLATCALRLEADAIDEVTIAIGCEDREKSSWRRSP